MALGKKIFEFSAKDMMRGMSTSDDLADGGFSPLTDAVNLTTTPGVLYAPASPTDKSTNVADSIIASCEDSSGTYNRLLLGTGGKFYGWNGTSMTLVATDATRAYIAGKTDMATFGAYTYGTSATYVWEWIVTTGTINQTYFAFPNSSGSSNWTPANVPHPTIKFEGNIYYGNGPQLLRQTALAGTPTEILLLQNSNETIVALDVDPSSGRVLISTTSSPNISDTLNNINRVYYYDGFSNKTLKVSIVDEMVTAFKSVGGLIYVGYGTNLGYWDGSGIQFLRKLNLAFDNTELVYKHHLTNIGTTLFIIEKTKILAHGQVHQGNRVFYYVYKNNINTNNIQHITHLGQGLLGISFATSKFYTLDTTSVSTTGTQTFFTNFYDFDEEVMFERVKIIWKNQVSNNVDPGSIRFLNEDGIVTSVGQSGIFDLKNTTGAAISSKNIENINIKSQQLQCEILLDTTNPGIVRIIGYGKRANE